MTINFKRKADGATLATVVLVESGTRVPQFYRYTVPAGEDPWALYGQIAANAINYLAARQKPQQVKPAKGRTTAGKLVQLRGVLPT
ncbi:MAG: hypothetical protein AB7E51_15025 [Pseudodesulfovibrio sp.]|uniref:hypothetical protein n=1 Tax=Pseudodesulfovibrio sp. TaxID=2035812 RepID=UPI003D122522